MIVCFKSELFLILNKFKKFSKLLKYLLNLNESYFNKEVLNKFNIFSSNFFFVV